MSDYTRTINFTAKDALTTGDPNKLAKGSDIDSELDNIASSSATKANKVVSATSGNVVKLTSAGDLQDAGYSFSNLTGACTLTAAELNALDGLTASRALVTSAGGLVTTSAVTATELGYLSGVTSAIQTQLNAKLIAANNLSDVADAATARTNLGIETLATQTSIAPSDLDDYITGSLIMAEVSDITNSVTVNAWTDSASYYIDRAGTVRVRFYKNVTDSNLTSQWRVLVNGATFSSGSYGNSGAYQTVEVTGLSAGDYIQISSRPTHSASTGDLGLSAITINSGNPTGICRSY